MTAEAGAGRYRICLGCGQWRECERFCSDCWNGGRAVPVSRNDEPGPRDIPKNRAELLDDIGRIHANLATIGVTPLINRDAAEALDDDELLEARKSLGRQLINAARVID